MTIITVLILLLMFITPIVSMMTVLLRFDKMKQMPRGQLTIGLMVLLAIVLHILGARGLIVNFLNLTDSSTSIAIVITTLVTLLLGVVLGLILQDSHRSAS